MVNTDWRSEFLEMWEYRAESEASVMGDSASDFLDFIEQTRIEAQIEVLEESMKFQEDLCDGLGDIGNWTEDEINALKQK